LRTALDRGPESVSYVAALSLARARDPYALRWILSNPDALSTRSHAARSAILRAFGRRALPVMAEALERGDSNPLLERALIDTVGLAGYTAGSPALERRLDAPDAEIRVAAARALGRIKAVDCAGSLIRTLHDPIWQVRAQAARTLGTIGATEAVEPLCDCLTDSSWWVRRHAAYALAALGDRGREFLLGIIAISPDPYARDIAREALEGGIRD
jgi:HEAT repeat protein